MGQSTSLPLRFFDLSAKSDEWSRQMNSGTDRITLGPLVPLESLGKITMAHLGSFS